MMIPAVMRSISHNSKMALLKGILLCSISILSYIIIVIVTTPQLPASFAIKAAFSINPIIIYGTAFGVGANVFISSYSKGMGCRVDKRRKSIVGVSSGSTALSARLLALTAEILELRLAFSEYHLSNFCCSLIRNVTYFLNA
jgi:hypothetical protein